MLQKVLIGFIVFLFSMNASAQKFYLSFERPLVAKEELDNYVILEYFDQVSLRMKKEYVALENWGEMVYDFNQDNLLEVELTYKSDYGFENIKLLVEPNKTLILHINQKVKKSSSNYYKQRYQFLGKSSALNECMLEHQDLLKECDVNFYDLPFNIHEIHEKDLLEQTLIEYFKVRFKRFNNLVNHKITHEGKTTQRFKKYLKDRYRMEVGLKAIWFLNNNTRVFKGDSISYLKVVNPFF